MKNDTNKIRSFLESEMGIILKTISLTVAAILFIIVPMYEIRQDVALVKKDIEIIKTNHLPHIEEKMGKLYDDNDLIWGEIASICSDIEVIKTILEK